MKNFPGENGNLSDSSIFKARIKKSELTSQEKWQEIQGAADELARQSVINKLRQAEAEHEKLKLKLEQEASDRVEDILSYVELSAAENEDNFISSIDGLLAKLFKFFNFMDSELGVETDPQVHSMIKEREEKEVWIAAVIKFLRDKFNKLIKAIFSRDLSFQEKIDKEIKELCEKLFSGSLSPEEEAAILQRLEALRDLKLKLQIFVVGTIIKMFAELFSVELTASVERTKEEGRNTEKTSTKEATKEVRENLEIKVDEKQKPTVPVSLFDFSSGVASPITLSKPELDLLRNQIKKIVELPPKPAINNENSVVPKLEVRERQGQENKKAIQESQKKGVERQPALKHGPAMNTMEQLSQSFFKPTEASNKDDRIRGNDINKRGAPTPGFTNEQKEGTLTTKSANVAKSNDVTKLPNITQSANEQKMSSLCNELAEMIAQAKPQSNFPPIDHWQEQVQSEITDVGVDDAKGRSVGRS